MSDFYFIGKKIGASSHTRVVDQDVLKTINEQVLLGISLRGQFPDMHVDVARMDPVSDFVPTPAFARNPRDTTIRDKRGTNVTTNGSAPRMRNASYRRRMRRNRSRALPARKPA